MKIKHIALIFSICLAYAGTVFSQAGQMDHSIYNTWEVIENVVISGDGKKVSWVQSPGKGDTKLIIYRADIKRYDTIVCGRSPEFSPGGSFMIYRISLSRDSLRSLQMSKKKPAKSYTLGIYTFHDDSFRTCQKVIRHQLPEKEGDFLAIHFEKEKAKASKKKDTLNTESDTPSPSPSVNAVKSSRKDKRESSRLMIINPLTNRSIGVEKVSDFFMSAGGKMAGLIQNTGDSLDSVRIILIELPELKQKELQLLDGSAKKICLDEEGIHLVFLHSTDTNKTKNYGLKYQNTKSGRQLSFVPDSVHGLAFSEHARMSFSSNGQYFYFGMQSLAEKEATDSLADDEKVRLDLWNYRDERLQPQQLKQVDNDKKKSHQAVMDLGSKKYVVMGNDSIEQVVLNEHGDAAFHKGIARSPYRRENSRTGSSWYDLYLTTVSGERTRIAVQLESSSYILPNGRHAVWFDPSDSCWHHLHIPTKRHKNLTKGYGNFYNEERDMPGPVAPYGFTGWSSDYRYIYLNDKYDIWQFDLESKQAPVNFTGSYGRKDSIRFIYQRTDPKETSIQRDKPILLAAFSEKDKRSGYYLLEKANTPVALHMESERASGFSKATHADAVVFRRSTFNHYPDIWLTTMQFRDPVKISDAGSQMEAYHWGSAELLNWISCNGRKYEGLLYKPAAFDEQRSYPMIVYFYERSSRQLHNFYHPTASRSTINPAFYANKGYLVFIPDIYYSVGRPGADAYDAVMSGVDFLGKNSWVDTSRMALQGQSWGGYQVAWIITRTNRFKAAVAGAPVSNMTSAYGGIRWGSGVYRAFQYERGQSRLGATLWDSLSLYIENSPLFFADRINTPLLIMSNDNDGAVPWYQGIEFFAALYRLNKPVWMLNYNGDDHNLLRWPNRVDFSIRMFQFFEHYLKEAPPPKWMTEGIPANEKGKNQAF